MPGISHHHGLVAFHETDAAGVAHFSRVLCWAEEAEHALLRECGIPVFGADLGWPHVHVQADYRRPLQAGDAFDLTLRVEEVSQHRIRSSFTIERQSTGETAVQGELVSCLVQRDTAGRFSARCIPEAWRQLLGCGKK
jgi:acyl-CoA thioesterase FadM